MPSKKPCHQRGLPLRQPGSLLRRQICLLRQLVSLLRRRICLLRQLVCLLRRPVILVRLRGRYYRRRHRTDRDFFAPDPSCSPCSTCASQKHRLAFYHVLIARAAAGGAAASPPQAEADEAENEYGGETDTDADTDRGALGEPIVVRARASRI